MFVRYSCVETFCAWCATVTSPLHVVIDVRGGQPVGMTAYGYDDPAASAPTLATVPIESCANLGLLRDAIVDHIQGAMAPGCPALAYRFDLAFDYDARIDTQKGTLISPALKPIDPA